MQPHRNRKLIQFNNAQDCSGAMVASGRILVKYVGENLEKTTYVANLNFANMSIMFYRGVLLSARCNDFTKADAFRLNYSPTGNSCQLRHKMFT